MAGDTAAIGSLNATQASTPVSTNIGSSGLQRYLTLLTLVIAGEAIFILPFIIPRVFRPTLLDVFQITNLELGLAFSVYGITAMLSYFPSGLLADRYPARKLMAVALLTTAAGGFYFATIPDPVWLAVVYGFWGITSILLFWAALMRATREWGGEDAQGSAFGLLDGGRGLTAAVLATGAVALLSISMPDTSGELTSSEQTRAFKQIIIYSTVFIAAVAVLVWTVLPKSPAPGVAGSRPPLNLRNISKVFRMPAVWLQAVIIVCAYVAYRGTDDISLYARDVLMVDEVEAAGLSALSLWLRPVAAIGAGLIADRISVSSLIIVSFILVMIGSAGLASDLPGPATAWAFYSCVVTSGLGLFALRGLYFAVMQESRIPLAYTGTAVGIVSVLGYTPDIFFGPAMGYLLDQSPGATGHQHVYMLVGSFALAGLIAAIVLQRINQRDGS